MGLSGACSACFLFPPSPFCFAPSLPKHVCVALQQQTTLSLSLSLSLDLQCGGVAFCCCMIISVHKLPRHEVCKGVGRAASSVRSSVCLPVMKLPLLWFVAFSDFSLRHYLPDSLFFCCSASCVNIPEFCLPVQRALKKERGIKYHHRSRAHLQFSSTDRHRHTRTRRHTHTETETESAGFLHPS